MRCTYCSWDNPEDACRCQKCNRPLERIESDKPSERSMPPDDWKSRPTMNFDSSSECQLKKNSVCPECSYPLMAEDQNCPNCGCSLYGRKPVEDNQGRKTVMDAGYSGGCSEKPHTVMDASIQASSGRATIRDAVPFISSGAVVSSQQPRNNGNDAPILAPISISVRQENSKELQRGDIVTIEGRQYLIV